MSISPLGLELDSTSEAIVLEFERSRRAGYVNLLNCSTSTATLVDTLYFDTSGDGVASPLDALLVINALNARMTKAAAEGESPVVSALLTLTDFESDTLRRRAPSRTQ